jgi:hypothetical protein
VSSAKEYREFADECFGWAKTAKTDRERDIFLQMATAWIEAARLAETGKRGATGALRMNVSPESVSIGKC